MQVGRLVPEEWLGRTLHVVMDRPLGSAHPSGGFVYEVNYGFVPGFISPDGEELDAYVVGPTEPLDRYTGEVVAVVLRADDVEDKVVVSREVGWTRHEIVDRIAFQEQHFDSTVVVGADDTSGEGRGRAP